MTKKTYIVTGENEDGWFLRQMNKTELQEWLAQITGGAYEEGDPIDFDDLEKDDRAFSVDCEYYSTSFENFVVIDGSVKEIKPKQLVTEVALE